MSSRERDTTGMEYTARLVRLQQEWWKRALDVQAPYRWHLNQLLGGRRVLDVGCGIGRNLGHLSLGSVGVDHNQHSISACRERGLVAYTVDEFLSRDIADEQPYDGLLAAHLLEHLPPGTAADVIGTYMPFLAPAARIVLICPQERGFDSDSTHTVFFDHGAMRSVCEDLGLVVERQKSFPLPRWAGNWFTYNEFVTVASVSPSGASA